MNTNTLNTITRVWILGAPDPEMEMIEDLLRNHGEEIIYALDDRGERVHPGNAYSCPVPEVPEGSTVYAVECLDVIPSGWVRIDHHRPGDHGYGRPAEDFMAASSVGQVISVLRNHGPAFFEAGEWITCDGGDHRDVGGFLLGMPYADTIPKEVVLAAAADHCLALAYVGDCPGVDPDDLMRWRAETRARHQGRSVEEVLEDIELAREALGKAPKLALMGRIDGDWDESTFHIRRALPGRKIKLPELPYFIAHHTIIYDLRHAYTVSTVLVEPFAEGATVDAAGVGDSREVVFGARDEGAWDEGGHHTFVRRGVPELPEAASREGAAYIATVVDRDGREKVVLGGCTTPEVVKTFMEQWAPEQGLTGIYGDPARGFAGGYIDGGAK